MTEGNIMPPTRLRIPAQRSEGHSEEWALVDQAQAGDRDAFDRLYRANLDSVRRFVHFRVGPGCVAEDIVQTAFMRAWSRRATFAYEGKPFAAILMTIARNLVVDHYKAHSTRRSLPVGELYELEQLGRPWMDDTTELSALLSERRRLLYAAMDELTQSQRMVVHLRFFEDLSVAETAARMNIAVGAVKALLYRACRVMRTNEALLDLFAVVDR